MARDDEFKIVASLDIPKSVSMIADDIRDKLTPQVNEKKALNLIGNLDITETVTNIQNQLKAISQQGYNFNIGITANVQSQINQIQKQVVSEIDITKKETDVLINEMIAKMQSLGTVDLSTFISNLKNNLGVGTKEIKQGATELYQALTLTPDNQMAIADSYTYLMDMIRNSIGNNKVVSDKNFDNRLVAQIFECATQMNNLGNASQNAMNKVTSASQKATQAVSSVSVSTQQVSQDLLPIETQYITTFENVANVIKLAEREFEKFGEVTAVSNKPAFTEGGIEYYKNFTIQVKSATGEVQKFKYVMQQGEDGNIFYQLQNINEAVVGMKKLQNDIDKFKVEYTSKLETFKKNNADLGLSKEITAVETALKNLSSYQDFDKIKTGLNELNSASSAIRKNLQSVGKSLDPVDLAIKTIGEAPIKIQELSNGFAKLKEQPKDVAQIIEKLNAELQKVIDIENQGGRNEAWSLAYKALASDIKNAQNQLKLAQTIEKGSGANSFVNDVTNYKATLSSLKDEWKQQGLLIGNVKSEVTSLQRGISSVKNPEKLQEYITRLQELATNVQRVKTNLDSQVESQNKIYQLQTQIAKLSPTDTSNKALLTQQLQDEEKHLQNLQMQSGTLKNIISLEEQEKYVTEQTVTARQNMTLAANHQADTQTANNISQMEKYTTSINNAIKALNNLKNNGTFSRNSNNSEVQAQISSIDQLLAKFTEMQTTVNNMLTDSKASGTVDTSEFEVLRVSMEQLQNDYVTTNNSARALQTQLKQDNSAQVQSDKIRVLISRLEAFAAANSKAMKSSTQLGSGRTVAQEWNDMMVALKNAPDDATFKRINSNFQSMRLEVKKLGLEGGTWLRNLWANIKKFSSWMGMTASITRLTMKVRQAVTEIKELDNILTEISKTSDRTERSLDKLGKTAFETASKYGRTASDYLKGVQEMSRAGFREQASEQMAELSILAQSAGDMTADVANKYLIATDAAYQLKGNTQALNDVLDGQNLITNKNAVNLTELAEGTSIVASQAANAGISADQLTAALGTMIATTQQSGSEMANALKGILINLQQIKGYTDEETGETFDAEKLSKYEKACEAMGVPLKEMKDGLLQLRNPMTVLEELANKYKELDSSSTLRANLLSAVGGKYRANALDSLLSHWDTYKKMLSEYNSDEAIGSAMEEANKSAENLTGRLNTLSNTFTDIVNNVVNSKFLTGTVNVLNDVLNFLNGIFKTLGGIQTIIPAILSGLTVKKLGEQLNTPSYALLQLCA